MRNRFRTLALHGALAGMLGGASATASASPIFKYFLDGLAVASDLITVFSVTGQNPATGLSPPIILTFTETSSQLALQITGGHITADTSETIGIGGRYWSGSIGITQDDGFFYDVVSMAGSFSHILGPHRDDGLGGVMQYTLGLSGFNPFFPSTTTVLIPNPSMHPNAHEDRWRAGITGNVSLLSEIDNWNAVIEANHVPEPSTLFLAGFGLLGLMATRVRVPARHEPSSTRAFTFLPLTLPSFSAFKAFGVTSRATAT